MSDQFDGIRLKRKRAWEQLHLLRADIDAYLAQDDPRPYDVEISFNTDTSTLTIRIKVQVPPNPMWSVRIGEILHDFRSSLDHLAFELFVLGNARRRPKREDKIQFPIEGTERVGQASHAAPYGHDA